MAHHFSVLALRTPWTVWEELPYDLAIPLLGKENKNTDSKKYILTSVHSIVYNSQDMEAICVFLLLNANIIFYDQIM